MPAFQRHLDKASPDANNIISLLPSFALSSFINVPVLLVIVTFVFYSLLFSAVVLVLLSESFVLQKV